MNNIILLSDSFKVSSYKQYPPGLEYVYSYLESRLPIDNEFTETVFFGLQYYLKKYLEGQVLTKDCIDYAEQILTDHFQRKDVFNRNNWEYIIEKHDGKLPVLIKAVPEGTIVARGNVLMTIENTDPKCYWLPNYLESLLLQIWYPITVATLTRELKIIILNHIDKSGSESDLIDFKLHDYGFRSVSSPETAGIGGCAHLVNFKSTNNLPALIVAQDYYDCPMAGYSFPGGDHSNITAWGMKQEQDAYQHVLEQYPSGLVAVVSDSYDIHRSLQKMWGEGLKDKILARDGCLIIRSDSGNPADSVVGVLNAMGLVFGYTYNANKYKVLNPKIKLLHTDGIDLQMMRKILIQMTHNFWAAENISFGSGGNILQKINRDTLKFVFKSSHVVIAGSGNDTCKHPANDNIKRSKKGRFKLINNGLSTVRAEEPGDDLMQEVFKNGEILKYSTLDEIRERAFLD